MLGHIYSSFIIIIATIFFEFFASMIASWKLFKKKKTASLKIGFYNQDIQLSPDSLLSTYKTAACWLSLSIKSLIYISKCRLKTRLFGGGGRAKDKENKEKPERKWWESRRMVTTVFLWTKEVLHSVPRTFALL